MPGVVCRGVFGLGKAVALAGLALIGFCPATHAAFSPPVIVVPPQSQMVLAGTNVTFSVGIYSQIAVTYQWYLTGQAIPGATTQTLLLTNVATAQGGLYAVGVANAAGSVSSNATLVVVSNVVQTPASVSLGPPIILNATVNFGAAVNFQWRYYGTNIPGALATRSSLTLTNAQMADVNAYSLMVSNVAGTLLLPTTLNIDPTFTKITTGPVVTEAGWSAGASWGDYDNDGNIDLLVGRQNGTGNRLFRNNGDGTFTNITSWANLTAALDTRATIWGDYDNDGLLDIFISNFGGRNFLYHNNGNGTFSLVTTNGPISSDTGIWFGAVWGDYDNDGFIDLFVSQNDRTITHAPSAAYHNEGNGSFTRALAGNTTSDPGISYAASWGDFNNDGLLDLFVANGLLNQPTSNYLYLGLGGGAFQKVTTGNVATDPTSSVGGSWGDYDNDGLLDLFVANDPGSITGEENHNFLYHNNGDGSFTRVTNSATGPIVTDPAVGWDSAWGDYDNDGYLDLFVANQDGKSNYLYHNKRDGTFERITTGSLANDQDSSGRGSSSCSWGDYDNDGFLDLFAGNDAEQNTSAGTVNYLYRNNGNSNGWLKLNLKGFVSNHSAIGAKVRVYATIWGKPVQQLREVSGGGGYRSQTGLIPHFGLGDATNIDKVRIEWPSGIVQEFPNVAPRQKLDVTEQGVAVFPIVQNLVAGSNVTFTAKTTFTGFISYQWQFKGANLPNQTNTTLSIQNPQTTDAGGYSVVITLLDGTVFSSSPALLRLPGPPVITSQSQDQIVAAGTNVTLSVGVVPSATPLSYQWSKNGTVIDTHSSLVLNNVTLSSSGAYSVSVSNSEGSSTSAVVNLEVVSVTAKPGSVSPGATVVLQGGVGGTIATTFQWRHNDIDIPGATLGHLTITNVQPPDATAYSLAFSNILGTKTLTANLRIDPTFSKLPGNVPIVASGGLGLWGDYDNDGFLDMYLERGTFNNLLFHNNGDGTFTSVSNAATSAASPNAQGGVWGDYDNDGRLDLLLADYGPGTPYHAALFHNDGNGNFSRVQNQALVNVLGVFASVAWADYDDDGFLDALLTSSGGNNLLFRGDQGTNFIPIATGPVVTDPAINSYPCWGDYDNDGFDDLFIINGINPVTTNNLYHNNGDGTFTRITHAPIGTPFAWGGWAVGVWADYDNDGFLDLFVTDGFPGGLLYHNNGDGTFSKVVSPALAALPAAQPEAIWGDYDNDGFLDLYVTINNGSNWLFHNNGDGTFSRVDVGSPVNDLGPWGGVCFVDYDNDGFLDLYVSTFGSGPNAFYHNSGNSNNWAKFKLVGTLSNRAAIGAKVRVHATIRGTPMWQLREISTADGFSADGLRPSFGLGDATNMDIVRIEWPSGIVQVLTNVAAKQFLKVTEQGVAIFPRAQNLLSGSNFTFTAKATFAGPFNYQWSFNGNPVMGATNATFLITNAQQANLGGYTVSVTGPGVPGLVSSSPALLRSTAPPLIAASPRSQLVSVGANAILFVQVALSATPLSYQWFFNGQPITNATSPVLQLANIQLSQGGNYSVSVANLSGTVTGAVATINVVQVSPTPVSVSVGASARFLVVANGGGSLAFQWAYNGVSIAGATRSFLDVTGLQPGDDASYSVVVTNSVGVVKLPAIINIDRTFTKITSSAIVGNVPTSPGVPNYPADCVWADFNNDGSLDLITLHTYNSQIGLYLNDGSGNFSAVAHSNAPFNFQSVATWADFNNDGYADVLISATGPAQLFRNNTNGTFSAVDGGQLTSWNVSASGSGSHPAAWADFDNDGWLDVCLSTFLFRNKGDGTFTNVTTSTLKNYANSTAQGGRVWGDYDNDGYPDLLIADYPYASANILLHNNGDGSFSTSATFVPAANGILSYSCAWADYDNDGLLDLFVANTDPGKGNFLYHNDGNGVFTRSTNFDAISPVNIGTYACAWGDYDNDGFLDLFLSNYGTPNNAARVFNFLFHNNGDGTFTRVLTGSPANDRDIVNGAFGSCSWADVNNDGSLDLYVASQTGNNLLYLNNGSTNSWVKVNCRGTISNAGAVGAKVRIKAFYRGASRWQLREISGGDGDDVSQPLLAHFGLGDATRIDVVRVEWPSGIVQELTNQFVNRTMNITEQGVAIYPRVQNLLAGGTNTFTAKTTFTNVLSYQWGFNGEIMPGETLATLVIPNAQTNNLGAYTVVVTASDFSGPVSSSSALLRWTGAPIITSQPQDWLVASGSDVTLNVGVVPSATPLTYQWLLNGLPVSQTFVNGHPLAGGIAPTLVLTNIAHSSGGQYSLVVSNDSGSTISSVATVTVMTVSPSYLSISLGVGVSLQASWIPFQTALTFQWLRNGTIIPNATNSAFSLPKPQAADSGVYTVIASNAAGTVSLSTTLNVDPTFRRVFSAGDATAPYQSSFVSDPDGCTWVDYNNSGYLGLMVWNTGAGALSGEQGELFRNNTNGSFTAVGGLQLAHFDGWAVVTFADVNNDGYLDALVSPNNTAQLFINNRNGTFAQTNAGRLTSDFQVVNQPQGHGPSVNSAWADYDNDGNVDVFLNNSLYKNNGDGTFTNITAQTIGPKAASAGNPRVWGDYDNDGFLDVYVSNSTTNNANFLFHNNGDGTFTEVGVQAAVNESGFGCAWADYDNDGLQDLFAGAGNENQLYHNNGDGTFTKSAAFSALLPSTNIYAYGCAWGDYDNDGFVDLFVSNAGDTNANFFARETNYLFHNNGDGTFTRVTTGSLVNDKDIFGGCSWGDYDNDGFLDLYVTGLTGQNYLYQNAGNSNGWVKVKCVGKISNGAAIGAKVRVKAFYRGATRWQLREITGGDGEGSMQTLLAHFGLGDATNIDVIRIEWPSGIVQEMLNVPVKTSVTVEEQGVAIYPRVQNLAVGSNATFTVKTTLTGSLSYQWSFDGKALPGETNPSLVVQNEQATNAGSYTVVVSGTGISPVSSSPALLRLAGPPVIAVEPQNQVVPVGSDLTLSVQVVPSTTSLSYHWIRGLQTFAGVNGPTLVLTNVDFSAAGYYLVVVTNSAGSTFSTIVQVTVVPAFRLTALPPVQGYFPLKVDAATGQVVVLQASTNLVQWQPILTNTATNGTFNFLDPDSVLFNRRFYRGFTPQ